MGCTLLASMNTDKCAPMLPMLVGGLPFSPKGLSQNDYGINATLGVLYCRWPTLLATSSPSLCAPHGSDLKSLLSGPLEQGQRCICCCLTVVLQLMRRETLSSSTL
eukprot:6394560-Amphidinium_carterae.1